MSRMENRIIGNRYLIKQQLGKGGRGTVYLCHDKKIHKDWAVKELEEPSDLERSMELELLKTISCNVFPRIVDIVKENGSVYLVMDYVEGISLKDKMNRQVLTEKEVLPWAKEIAKGIQYLHRMSVPILYMDCKPDNIMLTNEGEIRLVDLGSAYVCFKDKKQRISGTKYFAPKEQYKHGKGGEGYVPDARTDIYAFGMTLYYLLTGGKKERRRGGRLCVRDVNPSVSWGMSHIIEKCTMENPEQRYQSMEEVTEQLQHIRRIGRKKEAKVRLQRTLGFCAKISCASFVLYFAYGYQKQGGITVYGVCLILILTIIFLLFCRTEKKIMYEWNKDIFCGMGKRFLYSILLVCTMAGMICMKSYAADEKTAETAKTLGTYAETEPLKVVIYDEYGRKLLIKDGASWNIKEDILVSVPFEELETGMGAVSVFYENKSGDVRKCYSFYVEKK